MAAGNASPASWKQLYRLALLETDAGKITARVGEARSAISDRIRLMASDLSNEEHDSLQTALRFLRILEKETREGSL
jgi:hypothetical protein